MSQIQSFTRIEPRSGVLGERAFIVGHRVRVQDVVLWNEGSQPHPRPAYVEDVTHLGVRACGELVG